MKTRYIDLIEQSFDFPQKPFEVNDLGQLIFHGITLENLIESQGSPLRLVYLPIIRENISKVRFWFEQAMQKLNYKTDNNYCYCTKSNHFKYVLKSALESGASLETSSAYDIDIIEKLIQSNNIPPETEVVCNGFKDKTYLKKIEILLNKHHLKIIPILDNAEEVKFFDAIPKNNATPIDIGIRIASEEEPKFTFYTSRLGVGYTSILNLFKESIARNQGLRLKMLHFFINTGINDNSYYWNELRKCLNIYIDLKKESDSLDSLNIGGGFPFKNSLNFEYDYPYIIEEILKLIKISCTQANIPLPHIYTEFGSFTVAESYLNIYTVLHQKQQNDREKWNLINSSFMTTLPDTWAINKKFIMLPLNRWFEEYERVLLGGVTCDSEDYYNSEQHTNAIYLPKFKPNKPLHIGFFNSGAYQEALGGVGGIQHCLTPQPKKVLLDINKKGELTTKVFSQKQSSSEILRILGY